MVLAKRNILFVDDEPVVLHGYKRTLEKYLDHWNIFFATSGKDALAIMAVQPIDVIITDLAMPGMNGSELLEKINEQFPSVLRYVLSERMDNASAMQAFRIAHQYIPKPFEMSTVYESVERTCQLRDTLSNPDLLRIITNIKNLPSLPALYVTLMRELQSKEPTPAIVGDIISQDVSMTAKILQLVNSAFFGLPGTVTSPQKAVAILGLNTIKALVLNIHIFSAYQGYSSPAFSIEKLWQHSILVGNLCRVITANLHLDTVAQGNAQIAGVLHDSGKLLELNIPGFFQRVKYVNGTVNFQSEYQEIKTSHAEIGAYLLGMWGLPQPVVEAVAWHHRPAQMVSKAFNNVTVLHIANGLHHMDLDQYKNGYEVYMDMPYLESVGVTSRMDGWVELARRTFNP